MNNSNSNKLIKLQQEENEYHFYYGIPHAHTSYSDAKGTPTEAYRYARRKKLDFLIITDHLGRLIKNNFSNDKSTVIYGDKRAKWKMTKIEADAINSKYDDFIALVGFELSTKFWGHVNIINSKKLIDKNHVKIEDLYEWLNTEKNAILSINHPYRSQSKLSYSAKIDEFINLFEVGNGSPPRQYVRTHEEYFKALDEGWHMGAVNGQDNHAYNWGDPDNLTAVIAQELSEDSILNAIKLRRVYSTETRTLKLIVRANGHWMGSILNLKVGTKLKLQITAEDKACPIAKIQIISNGGSILKENVYNNSTFAQCDFTITTKNQPTWYVVKVMHSNKKMGVSSAVFVEPIDKSGYRIVSEDSYNSKSRLFKNGIQKLTRYIKKIFD